LQTKNGVIHVTDVVLNVHRAAAIGVLKKANSESVSATASLISLKSF
jgi:hypothetical protein